MWRFGCTDFIGLTASREVTDLSDDRPKAWRALLALNGRGRLSPRCLSWFSIDHPAGDLGVAVDAAVAQEGPVAAGVFHGAQVNFSHQSLFLVVLRFDYHPAERID